MSQPQHKVAEQGLIPTPSLAIPIVPMDGRNDIGHSSQMFGNGKDFESFPESTNLNGTPEPLQHKVEQPESKILKIWRGYVDYVGEETFFVNFMDENDKNRVPSFQVEFDKCDLSIPEQEFLVENAIIIWEIRVKDHPDGKQKKFYNLKLIKFAAITENLLERARARTKKILERYSNHETTSTG